MHITRKLTQSFKAQKQKRTSITKAKIMVMTRTRSISENPNFSSPISTFSPVILYNNTFYVSIVLIELHEQSFEPERKIRVFLELSNQKFYGEEGFVSKLWRFEFQTLSLFWFLMKHEERKGEGKSGVIYRDGPEAKLLMLERLVF